MIIKNGNVALYGENDFVKKSLKIESGKIVGILENGSFQENEIDAEGYYVFPGGIDAHVHFNTPGFEEREDFYHGSRFAASGGITSVIDMPCTSLPPITSLANLQNKMRYVEQQSVIDYAFYGGVSGSDFVNMRQRMKALADYVKGFKCYLISGMSSFGSIDYEQLQEILTYAKELHKPVLLHTEEKSFIEKAEEEEKKAGNKPLNYYRSRPEEAEINAVRKAAELAENCGAELHIVHVTTGVGADLAYRHGVSVETCPHYLAFSLDDFIEQGSVLKVAPVIKRNECGRLWSRLRDGKIAFVTSDHAACRRIDKASGSIWSDYAGIAGTGLLLPYMISEGYFKKRIDLRRLLEVTSENPAKKYGLSGRKGKIAVGMDADLVLIDPESEYVVRGKEFLSKSKMTPFEGKKFRGEISKTLVRGKVVYDKDKGILVEGGYGDFLGG